MRVDGAVAILTGAAEGLGHAIAMELADAGMRLAILDVQGDKLNQLAATLRSAGGDVLPIEVDLANAAATKEAAERALAHFGTPRVLIHNAAILRETLVEEITFERWREEVDVILQAAFILSKAVWQPMVVAQSGSIVFLSSGSAIQGFVKEPAYTPGKHGQEGLMKVLALAGKASNIAVNTIVPGVSIDTPMSASHYTEAMRVGMVHPSTIALAFRFMAGLEASTATGQRFNAFHLSAAMRAAGR